MEAWSRLQNNDPESILLVVFRQRDAAVEDCARHAAGARIMIDPQGQTAKRYNALWLPRAYALDERGVVAYAQPGTTLDSMAPLEVKSLRRAPHGSDTEGNQ